MRKFALLLFTLWLPAAMSVLWPGMAAAMERHALVIGNSDYLIQPLANPRNDALDVAAELDRMGYQIYSGGALLDLNRRDMVRALITFADAVPDNSDVLFYYAGHGISDAQENYLIPLQHQLEAVEQLPDLTISLRFVLERLKNANPKGTNVVLLDACRDNPLTTGFRSSRKGLSTDQEIPRGVFIGYAADSGQVAIDGEGRNGVYTAELLNVMRTRSNVIIDVAHREAVDAVIEKTDGKQFPVSDNKLFGKWCFDDCESEAPAPSTAFKPAPAPELPPELPREQPGEVVTASSGNRNTWLIVGGIALAVITALAVGSGGSDDNSDDPNFTLVLDPP